LKKVTERAIIRVVIATGISSVVTQLLTIREFLTQFQGNEIVIALILFNWLILGGIGTLIARVLDKHSPNPTVDILAWLSQSKKTYDAIIVNLPEPNTFQINRFYTDGFFQLAGKHLARDGVLSFSMQGFDNYLAEPQRQKLSSLYNSAAVYFKNVLLLPGAWLGNRLHRRGQQILTLTDGFLIVILTVFILAIVNFADRLPVAFYLTFGFAVSVACGFQFPVALYLRGSDNTAATRAFSADLIGAAWGTLLTSVVLIPYTGILWAAAGLIGLKLISLILIGTSRKRN
jgi:predicted membrane-bound spermidine synthase